MGYLKKLNKARLVRSMSFRRKSKELQSKTNDNGNYQTWEFQVTCNPKEYTDDIEKKHFACGTIDTVSTSRSGQEKDNNNVGTTNTATPQVVWGWLLSSCWGGSPDLIDKIDDVTFESSHDGTGDDSEPSMSRLDHVLELDAKKADDMSNITSAASMSIDDDDSNYSDSQSNYTQDESSYHWKLDGGNNCVTWSM